MKKLSILFLLLILVSCKKQTPPPPKPYTDKQVCRMYINEYFKKTLVDPLSLVILEESTDSLHGTYKDDSVTYYTFDIDYQANNEFGGKSRRNDTFVAVRGKFLALNVKTYMISEYGLPLSEKYYKLEDYEFLRKVELSAQVKEQAWKDYQDSIQNIR